MVQPMSPETSKNTRCKIRMLRTNMRSILFAMVLSLPMVTASAQSFPTPTGLWEFDNSSNIGQATIGANLTVAGQAPTYSNELSDSSKILNGVITTVAGPANRLNMSVPSGGNGGGSYTNEYTLLFDVFSPSASRSSWRCFFQTKTANSDDGDYFIKNSNDTMGTAALGYTSSALPESLWKRVVIVADLGSSYRVYVDGVLFHSHTSQSVDGRYVLNGSLLLFGDENSENAPLHVGAVAFWKQTLSDAQVAALGSAGQPITNHAPVIAEGASYSLPMAQLNGSAVNGTLTVTDDENDPITWTIPTPASHGTGAITSSTNSQASISYIPSAGYTGTDSFVVRAADANGSDSITVNVTVEGGAVVINEGSVTSLQAIMNGTGSPVVLHATEFGGNLLTWNISSAAQHGVAQVTGNNTTAQVTYVPTENYFGPDSFVVRAGNGSDFDEILVNVQVAFNSGNLRVFYTQDFNSASLLAEVTTSGQRRMPSGDNTPVWNTPQNSELGLLAGADNFLNPANDRILEFTGFNLMRSDFWSNGDDQSRSTAFARSTNVIAVADSDEFTDGDVTGDMEDEFNVFLRTPVIAIPAVANVSQMVLRFRSSFRSEENETSRVFVYLNGATTPSVTLNIADNGVNPAAALSFSWAQLGSPSTGSTLQLEFAHEDADNNWWWAIDDISLGILNQIPVITQGDSITLSGGMGSMVATTLSATDGENDPIIWSISTPPPDGNASVDSGGHVTYTPPAGLVGTRQFTVRASDGADFDEITVAVNVSNTPPVISEGATFSLSTAKNGGPKSATLHATDGDLNPLFWSIATAPSHGTVELSESPSNQINLTYAPAQDYSGNDQIVLQVSDGVASDSISVDVLVIDPTANPKLTIIAPFGTANPVPGTYEHGRGTQLTNSVSDQNEGTTRHICTGWVMIGDGPRTGTSSTMNMTLTRDSTLTWQFRSEHRVETSVNGNGTISVASGWYEAGKPIQITAIPGPGQYFSGWTGDTTGCEVGGRNLVVPMDRARSTITANFATAENFTIIALPDTQNYTSIASPTDLFTRQTQWVNTNKDLLNIKFVTHLGDIVNSPSSQSQWLRATDAMNLMNNILPYGTCPGNHDLASGDNNYVNRFGPNPTHSSSVSRWIDPDNSQPYPWYRGASPRGYSSYQIVNINGRDFMFLHLDMDCPDQDMAWAASVLAANPKVPTMITTHNYLAETGGTGYFGTGTGQRGYTAGVNTSVGPDRNRPQEVFDALVKPFRQVYMVICGHMFAIYNLQKTNNAGKTVHEVLVDYQSLPNGGNAYLRIMEFRPAENQIYNTSYSPYLGRYIDPNNNADHQGMLDLHDRQNGAEFAITTDFDTRFDSTFTVVSEHPTVSPAVGSHQFEDGSPISVTASQLVSGQSRYRPTGYVLTGGLSGSSSETSAVLTSNGTTTLTWNWATEHYLETQATGLGILSVAGGWQAAGSEVTIQAQPDPGAEFFGWSGDTDGCTINGDRITVPMTRPRGPITGAFTSLVRTYSVQVVSSHPGVNPAPATYTYEEGALVDFSAQDVVEGGTKRVVTGFTVSGDINQSGDNNTFSLTILGNYTVTWNWKTQHKVQALANGPGTVNHAPEIWVDEGASLLLVGTPSAGASLTSWSGDTTGGSANGNQFTIPAVNRPTGPITANFELGVYTLTVESHNTTTNPPPGTVNLPFGTVVDFSAWATRTGKTREVPTGWALSGETTDAGSTKNDSFVITGNTTLTWSWAPEVLLELTSGAEGVVLPMAPDGWKPAGATVQMNAVPADGFEFRTWYGDVVGNPANPALELLMSQPREVTPDFHSTLTTGGTPKWWLERHSQVTGNDYEAAGAGDFDGDGTEASEEFLAGTSDRSSAGRFNVTLAMDGASPGAHSLQWPSAEWRNYRLLGGSNLKVPLANDLGVFEGTGLPINVSHNPGAVSSYFYRVEASLVPPPADSLDPDPMALSHAPRVGSLIRDMVLIPGGNFTQGDDNGPTTSRPAHTTHVRGFFMDKFEVTREDWEQVATWARDNGYDIPVTLLYNQAPYNVPMDHPAVAVSWYDAAKWCNARSEMEGRRPAYYADANAMVVYRTGQIDLASSQVNWAGDGYRLPTEAEWERASRGGLEGKRFAWGDADPELRANHWNYQLLTGRAPDQPYPYTERVGHFDGTQSGGGGDVVNGYGLYDMAGNAWEWVWDRMGDYQADEQFHPRGPDIGNQRVQRGGSWWNYTDQATNFQRLPFPPDGSDDYGMIGFRCARGAHPNEIP